MFQILYDNSAICLTDFASLTGDDGAEVSCLWFNQKSGPRDGSGDISVLSLCYSLAPGA